MRDSNPSMVVSCVTLIKLLSVYFFSSNSLIFKKQKNDKTSRRYIRKRKGIEHWKYFGRVVVVIGMALTFWSHIWTSRRADQRQWEMISDRKRKGLHGTITLKEVWWFLTKLKYSSY